MTTSGKSSEQPVSETVNTSHEPQPEDLPGNPLNKPAAPDTGTVRGGQTDSTGVTQRLESASPGGQALSDDTRPLGSPWQAHTQRPYNPPQNTPDKTDRPQPGDTQPHQPGGDTRSFSGGDTQSFSPSGDTRAFEPGGDTRAFKSRGGNGPLPGYRGPQPGRYYRPPGSPQLHPESYAHYAFTPPPQQPAVAVKPGPGWPAIIALVVTVSLLTSAVAVFAAGFSYTASPASKITTVNERIAQDPVVTSTRKSPDWAAVSKAVRPAVVSITARRDAGTASGSGVIIDDKGHIVTNDHVVAGVGEGTDLIITLHDGQLIKAKIVGTDPANDLAVLKLEELPKNMVVAQFGKSSDVIVGEPVVVVGSPLGLNSTVTTGIVSAIDRPVTTLNASKTDAQPVFTNAIQVDAAINPGNSGGPLFDSTGRIIGITSSIATISNDRSRSGSIGLGFAIPSDLANRVASDIITKGKAQHAFLGVVQVNSTATYDGVTRSGAKIQDVTPGTAAAAAGLQVGDVVVSIDGKAVEGADAFVGYIRQRVKGDKPVLGIVRGGKYIEITPTLGSREDTN